MSISSLMQIFNALVAIAVFTIVFSIVVHFSELSSVPADELFQAFFVLRSYLYSINGIFPVALFSLLFKVVVFSEIGIFISKLISRMVMGKNSPI